MATLFEEKAEKLYKSTPSKLVDNTNDGGGLDDRKELVVGEGGEERADIVRGEVGGGGEDVRLLAVVVVVHGWDLWKDSGLE
ncbi:hypothetical protein RHMOL_Rhmol05G0021300 [Rhododendron molle]|uniref:Uncharacterized protein n=1 Tax=Rhododendron molle TaxID=49168 RepID=A0ACC0NJH3_RHOML|nr:hypothetical protein RHMOL_Rhmol05G0021300 [Rhododendron molle]